MSPEDKKKPEIRIKKSQGFVIGDFATVINNFWDEKVIKRFGLEQRASFIILFLTIISVGAILYFALRPKEKEFMTGEFRIAIASFDEHGKDLEEKIGFTIADGINLRLEDDLKEITVGPKIELWGPEIVGEIRGKTEAERAENAEKLAREIHAHMIIYGTVTETENGMVVAPEFYLDTQGFHEGSEITGQYGLGGGFDLPAANNPAWAYEFDKEMTSRSDIISSFAIGLSYFAVYEYEKAVEVLQNIEKLDTWQDEDGKEVLYALLGFSAYKAREYDLAKLSLDRSIEINPDYSRPYIGLASLNYLLSLEPFEASNDPTEVNQELLDNCFSYLDLAVDAPIKPPLAEVDTKIHFARGQCYWLKTYTGYLPDFELAMAEFQEVISFFDNGKNLRIRELAAEAHARLGLIYRLTNQLDKSVEEYEQAAKLLYDRPERQLLFQNSADEVRRLSNKTN